MGGHERHDPDTEQAPTTTSSGPKWRWKWSTAPAPSSTPASTGSKTATRQERQEADRLDVKARELHDLLRSLDYREQGRVEAVIGRWGPSRAR